MHLLNSWKTQIYKSMLNSVATAWVKTLIMLRGGGYSTSFIRGGFFPRSYPLPSYIPFLDRKGTPFVSSTDKWYPFHILSLELCIPLFCRLFHSHKMHLSVSLFGLFQFFFLHITPQVKSPPSHIPEA